jgi:hypothetical protein
MLLRSLLIILAALTPVFGASRSAVSRIVADSSRDQIIPYLFDGGGWSTNLILTNFESHTIQVQVEFWANDGSQLQLPVDGVGTGASLTANIAANGTASLRTSDFANSRIDGYAYVTAVNQGDRFAGYAVIKNITSGLPNLEFTIPLAPLNENRFTLAFDNSNGYDTGVALVNSSQFSATVNIEVTDQYGNVLATDQVSIPPLGRVVNTSLSTQYPPLGGTVGSIFFSTDPSLAVTGMGIRFGPNDQSWTTVIPFSPKQ